MTIRSNENIQSSILIGSVSADDSFAGYNEIMLPI